MSPVCLVWRWLAAMGIKRGDDFRCPLNILEMEIFLNDSCQQINLTEVAAAVLQRPDGTFLLAQRPVDKIWAGYWEFPGGKMEVGETPYDALVRELHEELGIAVETAYPWVTRVFAYPHATVRLNFFRVTGWSGELHPHEGQKFAWQHVPDISVAPVLPANAPILRGLELPALYAISNVAELGEKEFMLRLEALLHKGLRLVQLREKNLSHDELRGLALRVVASAHAHGAKVLLNSDVALAQQVGADGVQLTGAQLAGLSDRPAVEWCAASCHSTAELRRAEKLGCDFALLSPVLPTQSHPGAPHLGWEGFAAIVAGASIPVYALGGLSVSDMETAWRHGAHGVALLRQAWL
jgi:8-oxo-dGTP diphosphatase